MNTKDIFREELARQGVLNSFPATPDNLKSFMGALEAAQIRIQTAFNEIQQKLVNSEQTILNKDTAIAAANTKFTEQGAKLVNKQNEIDNLNEVIEGLHKKIVVYQTEEQVLHQSLSDKDGLLEKNKADVSKLTADLNKLKG